MSRWRAEYDDGIWRFYRDGMELGLYEKGDVVVDALNAAESRIAELEAEIDQLTAHDATERQDDKCSKPEPNVCEACGGDGTVLLRDGYEGQVIATAECIYCNGTGRVSKERE